jgi:magnesium transporter
VVTLYYKYNDRLIKETDIRGLSYIDFKHLLWIDLNNLTEEEKSRILSRFHIQFQDLSQLEEIESSSRFIETDRMIVANSNFLVQQGDSHVTEPASFILKNNYLITYRNCELRSFNEIIRRLETTPKQFPSGYHIMVSLFETRIDLDADHLESIARNITVLSKAISNAEMVDKDLIFDITNYQETTMQIRQNIIDKQRVISALMRSEYFPKSTSLRSSMKN